MIIQPIKMTKHLTLLIYKIFNMISDYDKRYNRVSKLEKIEMDIIKKTQWMEALRSYQYR